MKTFQAAAVVALLAGTAAAGPPAKEGAKAFAPKDAGFSVAFPGKPTAAEKKVDLPDGETLTLTCYVHEPAGPDRALLVTYCPLPDGAVDDEDGALDGAVAGFAGALGLDPPEAKAVVLNGHPGRAFELEVDGRGKVRGRIYLANGRLYQVVAAGPGDFTAGDAAARFFRSFKLTGPAGTRGD